MILAETVMEGTDESSDGFQVRGTPGGGFEDSRQSKIPAVAMLFLAESVLVGVWGEVMH